METWTRFVGFLPPAALDLAIGTTAVQISGSAGLANNSNRQFLTVSNPPKSLQNLLVGTVSSIAADGTHVIWTILPGQEKTFQCNGTANMWAVAVGASNGLITLTEGY